MALPPAEPVGISNSLPVKICGKTFTEMHYCFVFLLNKLSIYDITEEIASALTSF